MSRYFNVNSILNRVGSEVGLIPVSDPFSDAGYQQLRYLLDSAGQEMVELFPWPVLTKEHSITTVVAESGDYDLPDDYAYMIDQTGWNQDTSLPLAGPLSPQNWTFLNNSGVGASPIHVSFRMRDGLFSIHPQPIENAITVSFEYISRNWIQIEASPYTEYDIAQQGSDLVLFEPILMIKFLKAKYLEAKGFDSNKARQEFGNMYDSTTGRAAGAPILNASGVRGSRLLDPMRNTPDSNYGS